MSRNNGRSKRSSGHSGGGEPRSIKYSGRSSWPAVEWQAKHDLKKLGLPGYIVLHKIQPPAPAPASTPASTSLPTTSAAPDAPATAPQGPTEAKTSEVQTLLD